MTHNCLRHEGDEVVVGSYEIRAGGLNLSSKCLKSTEVLVTLCGKAPHACQNYDFKFDHLQWNLVDFGGVPPEWKGMVTGLIGHLAIGSKVTIHCAGGFGRTGTLVASLIALLEPGVEDPIAETRERYCPGAVETQAQAAAVFALKGQPMPSQYKNLRPGR